MDGSESFRILIADDHPVVREGLVALLGNQLDMKVVAEARTGSEALAQFVLHRPDVALLDLRMPMMDGIETVIAIREKIPTAQIVILSAYEGEEDVYRALRAGAHGYLTKDTSFAELVTCIRVVGRGRTWIPPQVGAQLARRVADHPLTKREMEVLHSIARGKSNKEIGVTLNIAESTVKVHVTHILEKMKITGRGEAIGLALKRGLVHLDSPPSIDF